MRRLLWISRASRFEGSSDPSGGSSESCGEEANAPGPQNVVNASSASFELAPIP